MNLEMMWHVRGYKIKITFEFNAQNGQTGPWG